MAFRRRSGFRKRTASRRFTRRTNRVARRSFGRPRYNKFRRTKVRIPNRIMPDYTLVKMKDSLVYVTGLGSTPSVIGEQSTINFNIAANDLFDAFDSLGAPYDENQPTGFDQWMAFYNNFLVHKSSISIVPLFWATVGAATTGQPPFQITITPVTVSGLVSSNIDFDEQPYARYRVYNAPLAVRTGTASTAPSTGSQSPPKVFNSIMSKKIMGVKDLVDYSAAKGTATSSPIDLWYWNVEIKSLMPAAAATQAFALSALGLKIDINYKVQLMDRNTIPESQDPEE